MFDSDFIINPYRAYSHLRAAAQKFSSRVAIESKFSRLEQIATVAIRTVVEKR
jgi:hypothetical protein